MPFYPAADDHVQPAPVHGAVACRCCVGPISRSSCARRYPSDMSEAEWAICEPSLPGPAWLAGRGGAPEAVRLSVHVSLPWRTGPQRSQMAVSTRLAAVSRLAGAARPSGL